MELLEVTLTRLDDGTTKMAITGENLNEHQHKSYEAVHKMLEGARKWLYNWLISDPANYWGPEGDYRV